MSNRFTKFSLEKVTISALAINVLRILIKESYPLNQEYLSKRTKSGISGVSKALDSLSKLGLVAQIRQTVFSYFINPYRKKEIETFLKGHEFGKNKPLILSGHAFVYEAKVNEFPKRFGNYLVKKESFICGVPKNWNNYSKQFIDGTVKFHRTKHSCKVFFFVKTFGQNERVIEMVNTEKILSLIRKLEDKYIGLKIGSYEILARCPWQEYAIQKEPISVTGITLGIKHKKIEQSYGYPEWEERGVNAVEAVRTVIAIREFCVNNEIDERELLEVKDDLMKLILRLRNKVENER